jgi:putative tricarboxylic transport membrane protein
VILAVAVVALGIYVSYEGATGPDNPGYAQVGPGAFPIAVGIALAIAGLALLAQGMHGRWRVAWIERDAQASNRLLPAPLRNVLLVAAALILDVMLMPPLGFVAASAVMFTLVAAAFGSQRFMRDAALGLAFAAAIHLVFVQGLGLHLPVGSLWEDILWTR